MRHYLNIYLEGLKKSHKTCQNSQSPGLDLKLEPIKYKAAAAGWQLSPELLNGKSACYMSTAEIL